MSDLGTIGQTWSKKRKMKAKAALARSCKQRRLQGQAEDTVNDPTSSVSSSSSTCLDDSLILPVINDLDSSDDVEDAPFSSTDANEAYKEWIGCQCKDNVKMMAIILMDTFIQRFGLTNVAAATEAGLVVGYNEQTFRNWHSDFYACKGEFSCSAQGKHNHPYVLDDENCRKKALSWLRETAYKKGQPNMTASTFATWINTDLLPNSHLPPGFPCSITPRTARKWLHDLGFSPRQYIKGLYFDGHEREDVTEYRRIYLRKLEILQASHSPPPSCPGGETEETIGSDSADKRPASYNLS